MQAVYQSATDSLWIAGAALKTIFSYKILRQVISGDVVNKQGWFSDQRLLCPVSLLIPKPNSV